MSLQHFLPRELPEGLESLAELAFDLRWNAGDGAAELWRMVDPELWESTRNPVLIVESVSHMRVQALATDDDFMQMLNARVRARNAYLEAPTWLEDTRSGDAPDCVAYFSMEFGLSENLPIYSGGLGLLAGDHLKTASDLGLPLVGVGLLYQQGYFRQSLDAQGEQLAFYPFNDPLWLPVTPLRDAAGEWLSIELALPGRTLILRTWLAHVGRIMLYLLDSNDPRNDPRDRSITAELYGGGPERRLQQEMVLGIGGWRLLEALELHCEVLHLNEGHAAFAVLERAHSAMATGGLEFATALRLTRVGNLFTTHTPVPAGFDRFEPRLIEQYLGDYAARLGLAPNELLALGRSDPDRTDEPFNMAVLALRGSGAVNGVSRLHGEVSRRIFTPLFPRLPLAEVPVGHVTNGVHIPSWESQSADELWSRACGEARWRGDLATLEADFRGLPATALWSLRCTARRALVDWVRIRHAHQIASRGASADGIADGAQILDPDTLTLGFARRFAAYKRPNLLLSDPDRLQRLLADPQRPVQLVIAGKAHPRDEQGQRLVRAWSDFLRRPDVRLRAVFVEDYDIAVATQLVQGVDLWINTPRRPWEASGTSGMKILVNGGLNLSELDGWWAEAYRPEVGWSLGDGAEHGEDPGWDRHEAEALYALLEQQVVPAFYDRDSAGLPQTWLAQMRESMAQLTGQFSTNRMVREYTETYYLRAAQDYRARTATDSSAARDIERWIENTRRHWPAVRIATVRREADGGRLHIDAQVHIDDLQPDDVRVELYADPESPGDNPQRIALQRGEALAGSTGGYRYHVELATRRSAEDFSLRVIPEHPLVRWPLEIALVRWER
ncbi:MAG: alpha-glucan family phosphorylase [Gammaproteobacteria bacterium]|jgi:starch phosphorylase